MASAARFGLVSLFRESFFDDIRVTTGSFDITPEFRAAGCGRIWKLLMTYDNIAIQLLFMCAENNLEPLYVFKTAGLLTLHSRPVKKVNSPAFNNHAL